MKRGVEIISVLSVLFVLSLSSCGGGGGGTPGASSPYSGITTAAAITDNNADAIARGAFAGSDLGASTVGTLAPARPGDGERAAGRPAAVTLVRLLSQAANTALPAPASVRAPAPRAMVTVDNTLFDGMGGTVHFVLSVDDQTGTFTGTFAFTNFHGDAGGILDGAVAVSGAITQDSMHILFNFQSVRIVDGVDDVTAWGTVNLTAVTDGAGATLNLVFTDNVTRKTVWLSNYTVSVTIGTGSDEIRMSGRIYLHDYGYVDFQTESGFVYPALSTQPTSGVMTVTGSNNCRARFTVVDATTYKVELDADGNGSYEWTVTHAW